MSRCWLSLLDSELLALKDAHAGNGREGLPLAKALNVRGRHREAADLLDACLVEQRGDGDAWFERLVTLGDGPTEEEARVIHEQLESLRDEHPHDAVHLRNLGYFYLVCGDFDLAERHLGQALHHQGQDPKTLELMGLFHLQSGHPAEAKAWLLKALSLAPKDPRSLRLLGLTLVELHDYSGAETQLVAALEASPNYYWGWHALGELLIKRRDFHGGFRCIHRARSLNPAEPASYFIVAELLGEQGHLEQAQAELHALMLQSPTTHVLSEAQSLLGEFRRDLGDREGAVSYFTLAAEMDPAAANPWAALGDMAREEGRWENAIHCYREALVREPEAADVQVQLGYGLLETGQAGTAEQAFLQALESDPGEYSAYLGLSECYRLAHRHDDQLAMVKEAMSLAPQDPDVWNAYGVALEGAARLMEATEAYEKAIESDPCHRKAANNLGFLLEKRMEQGEPGLHDRALLAWKRRLLICRDENQSLKMATEHLTKLGVTEEKLLQWLANEKVPGTVEA